jgi:LysM domain-containing protein
MPSLSAHLRLSEDHSALPFHPSCPVCRRDRLAGALTGDEIVSRKTQAAIAAGLVAFSGVGAPTAIAADPDTVSEGTGEVVDGADPDSLDIGEDTIQLPDEASTMPEAAVPPADVAAPAADGDDAGPVEQERVSDVVEPVVGAADDLVAPPAEAPASPEPEPVAPSAPEPLAAESAPVETGIKSEASKRRGGARERRAEKPTASRRVVHVVTQPEPAPIAAPAPVATASPAAQPVPTRVVTGAATGRASAGDRFHTVQRGESLWSIASDVLGEGASVARVAREVNRLWELNEDRIASGSPDLLFAGTRLRLR